MTIALKPTLRNTIAVTMLCLAWSAPRSAVGSQPEALAQIGLRTMDGLGSDDDGARIDLQTRLRDAAGSLPMPFIENAGQVDATIAYYAPTFGGTVWVTHAGEVVYSLPGKSDEARGPESVHFSETLSGGVVDGVVGLDPSATRVSYFLGRDESGWRRGIPTFGTVSLGERYPGIRVDLRAYGNNVEKLFVVGVGAEPELIQLSMTGAEGLSIDDEGQLVVATALGAVAFTKPVAYQEIGGKRRFVEAGYVLLAEDRYGFALGHYSADHELTIDPLLASTFLGGGGDDYGHAIAVDTADNVYVTGITGSTNFPTAGSPYASSFSGGALDVFVSKLDSDLNSLLASSFLGGSGIEYGQAIGLDSSNNVYVTGWTASADFPTVGNPYDGTFNGDGDVFVSKLDGGLDSLAASTFIGGSTFDYSYAIAFDTNEDVYVAGRTLSLDFPMVGSPYDSLHNGVHDAFVAKLSGDLTALSASTFLGGGSTEGAHGLVLDSSNQVYATGFTQSSNFPTTSGSYDTSFNGSYDVFVVEMNSGLSALSASTFLGGNFPDEGQAIALSHSENTLYITGYTKSSNFPVAGSAFDNTYNLGDGDAFVAGLSSDLATLSASTFLGGEYDDRAYAIALDGDDNVFVTGRTQSTDFPTAGAPHDSTHNGNWDVFVTELNSGLTALRTSTFLGGSSNEFAYGLALGGNDAIYLAGRTFSTDFPALGNPYDGSANGSRDVFVAKLDLDSSSSPSASSRWPLDENAGCVASDVIGTNDGALGPSCPNNASNWVTGRLGAALEFDGTDDVVEIAADPSLQPDRLTVMAWVNPNALGNFDAVLMNASTGGWVDGYGIFYRSADGITFFVNHYNVGKVSAPLSSGIWTHVAATYDGAEIELYLDGTLADTLPYSQPIDYPSPLTTPLLIGKGVGGSTLYGWQGAIDDVQLFDRALSGAEIQSIFQAQSGPAVSTATWSFDENSGCVASDSEGTNGGALGPSCPGNAPTWVPGEVQSALSFDGVDDVVEVAADPVLQPTEITVAAWVNPDTLGNWDTVLMHASTGSWGDGYGLYYRSNTGLNFYVNHYNTRVSAPIVAGAWTHIAATYQQTEIKLYIDGALADTLPYSQAIEYPSPLTTPLLIGKGAGAATSYVWDGAIDEVQLFGRALSEAEILALYLGL